MLQTVILLLMIAAQAALVVYNNFAIESTLTLTIPWTGMQVTLTHLVMMAFVTGGFALLWLAGVADRAGLERRVRQQDAALNLMGEEMLRMKSSSYDQERPPLDDLRVRLEGIERDLRAIRLRLGEAGTPRERDKAHIGTGGS